MRFFLFFILLVCTGFQQDKFIEGKVVGVADGDTITILTDAKVQIKIRLYGIDCPEKGQDFGTKAKKFTSDFCFGKKVRVKNKGTDRYKRMLGIVYVNSGNLNEELLINVLAWQYKYNKLKHYTELEQEARNKKLNMPTK